MDDKATGPTLVEAKLDKATIRKILAGVILAMFLGGLDQTIVVTALPTIGDELGDLANLPWVVTAYLLSATAVTPLYGKLADIVGRRKTMLTAIAVFIVGSILCGLSRSMLMLIAARFIQGIGGGSLIVLGHTITGDIIPPSQRMKYQAYFAAAFVISSVAGPVLGGVIAEHLHWSWIFWINLPIGAIAYGLAHTTLRHLPRHERPHKLDVAGAILMALAAIIMLLGLSWGGNTYPWASGQILGLFALSAILWGLFALRIATAAEPFLPLDILADRVVRTGTAASFCLYGMMVALPTVLPLYFQTVLGLGAAQSGYALIVFMAAVVIGTRVTAATMLYSENYKLPPAITLVAAIAGALLLGFFPGLPLVGVELLLALVGAGLGSTLPMIMISIQNAVEPHRLGTTTAGLNFFRSLGSAIFVAGANAIVVSGLGVGEESVRTPAALAERAATQGGSIAPAFGHVFLAAAVVIAVGLACLIAIPLRPLRTTTWTVEP